MNWAPIDQSSVFNYKLELRFEWSEIFWPLHFELEKKKMETAQPKFIFVLAHAQLRVTAIRMKRAENIAKVPNLYYTYVSYAWIEIIQLSVKGKIGTVPI